MRKTSKFVATIAKSVLLCWWEEPWLSGSLSDGHFEVSFLLLDRPCAFTVPTLYLKSTPHHERTPALLLPTFSGFASNQVCVDHCAAVGAAYAATQYGYECWCYVRGRSDFDRHGNGSQEEDGPVCDMPCFGDEVNCLRETSSIIRL